MLEKKLEQLIAIPYNIIFKIIFPIFGLINNFKENKKTYYAFYKSI